MTVVTSENDNRSESERKKIFYWGPYGENIGTVQGMINSVLAVSENGVHEAALISCCGEWHEFDQELQEGGCEIYDLGLARFWPARLPKNGKFYRLFMFFVLLFSPLALAKLIDRQKPDYIITCLLAIPVLLARFFARHQPQTVAIIWGLPSFMMRNGDKKSSLWRRAESWLRYRLWQALYSRIEYIAAVSDSTRERIIETFGYSDKKVIRLCAPVATKAILAKAQIECRHRWLSGKTLPVVTGLGRLCRQKGFDVLIRAFAKVLEKRQARLLVLGEGELREPLQALIYELGITDNVELAGFYPNPFSFLKASDVFVLSSRWEDPCHAIIEAGYIGVPIVTTDCPSGPGEFIGFGEGGRLCSVDDVDAMAEAIVAALAEPAAEKIAYCKDKCEKLYTPQAHYLKLIDVLGLKS